jgi:hypothetical protein
VHEALFREHPEDFLQVMSAELLRTGERQLEGRALDVIHEDMKVVRVDERALGRRFEEVRRVADHELIERRAARHHDRGRSAGPAAGAAGALPRGRDGARIAGQHGDVERADVDAELEGIGRHHCTDDAFPQALLDLAAPQRQVAAAVSADSFRPARYAFEIVLQVRRQDFRCQAALSEHDQLQIALEEF